MSTLMELGEAWTRAEEAARVLALLLGAERGLREKVSALQDELTDADARDMLAFADACQAAFALLATVRPDVTAADVRRAEGLVRATATPTLLEDEEGDDAEDEEDGEPVIHHAVPAPEMDAPSAHMGYPIRADVVRVKDRLEVRILARTQNGVVAFHLRTRDFAERVLSDLASATAHVWPSQPS